MSLLGITISKESDNSKVKEKIEKVSKEIDSLQFEIKNLDESESKLKSRVQLLKDLLKAKKENLEFHFDNCDKKKEAIEDLSTQEEGLSFEVTSYEKKLSKAQKNLRSLTLSVGESEANYLKLKKEKENLRQRLYLTKEALQKEKEKKGEKEEVIHILSSEVSELEHKMNLTLDSLKEMKSAHEEAESRLFELRKKLDQKREENCTLAAEIENLRKKEVYLKESTEVVERNIQESSNQLNISKAHLDQEVNILTIQKENLLNLQEAETKNQIKINSLGQELHRVKEDASLVSIELAQTKTNLTSQEIQEREVESKILELKSNKKLYMQELQLTKRELDDIKSRFDQKENRFEELTKWVDELEEQKVVLTADVKNKQRSLNELEQSLLLLEGSALELKETLNIQDQSRLEVESKKRDLQESIQQAKRAIETLKEESVENTHLLNDAELELANEQARYNDLSDTVATFKLEIENDENFLKETNEKIETLRLRTSELKKVEQGLVLNIQDLEDQIDLAKSKFKDESLESSRSHKKIKLLTDKKKELISALKSESGLLDKINTDSKELKENVSILQETVEKLELDLVNKRSNININIKERENLESQSLSLKKGCDQLKSAIDQNEIEASKLKLKLKDLEKSQSSLVKLNSKLDEDNREKIKALEISNEKIKGLSADVEKLEAQKSSLIKDKGNHSYREKELTSKLNSQLSKRNILSEEVKGLNKEFSHNEEIVKLENEKLAGVISELEILQKRKLTLEEGIHKLQVSIQSNKIQLIDKNKNIENLIIEKKELEEAINRYEANELMSKEELSSQENLLRQTEIEKKSLIHYKERVVQKLQKVDEALEETSSLKANLEKEIVELRNVTDLTRECLKEEEQKFSALNSEIETLELEKENEAHLTFELEENRNVQKLNIKELSKEKEAITNEIKLIDHKNTRLKDALDLLLSDKSYLESEVLKVKGQLETQNEKSVKINYEKDQVMQMLEEMNQMKNEYIALILDQKHENDRLEETLKEDKRDLERAQTENFEKEKMVKMIAAQKNIQEESLSEVNDKLQKKKRSIDSLSEQYRENVVSEGLVRQSLLDKKRELDEVLSEEISLSRKIKQIKIDEVNAKEEMRSISRNINNKKSVLAKRKMEIKSLEFCIQMDPTSKRIHDTKKQLDDFESFVGLNFFEVDLVIENRDELEGRSIPMSLIRDYKRMLQDFSNSVGIIKKLSLSLLGTSLNLTIEGLEHKTVLKAPVESHSKKINQGKRV